MAEKLTLSGLNPSDFKGVRDNKNTQLNVLCNSNGLEVCLLNYGARIVSMMAPDKDGKLIDVVTGHSSLADYLATEEPYFGAICGRYANRIAKGRFELDGITYDKFAVNNGPNHLHGGIKGFNSVVWDVETETDNMVSYYYESPDGEEGYPGNLKVHITYELKDDNGLYITYHAKTDKTTVLNLTNHAYFNLSGAGDPSVYDHQLQIFADYYLPTDETAIPYGKPAKVADTPMDFLTFKEIGLRIDDDFEPLRFGRGYDHCYLLNTKDNPREVTPAACCYSPKSGIKLEIHTDQPGMQLYTGNWMTGNLVGKNGQRYPARAAVCFETQHYPDSPNKPDYPSTVLKPDDSFNSTTIFFLTNL
ncbi:MAG: galactose mutarotase [Tannerella sp.]|jgi:aldose 1-epimerase|nr:galactose mutarotase [Tannerella sp.]